MDQLEESRCDLNSVKMGVTPPILLEELHWIHFEVRVLEVVLVDLWQWASCCVKERRGREREEREGEVEGESRNE